MNRIWSHGGSPGDIIAQLTPLYYYWKLDGSRSEFYINRNCHPHWRQTDERNRSLLTLIEAQPYVAKCGIVDDYCGVNLDHLFRHPWLNGMNLSDIVNHRLGIPHQPREEPWLFNVQPRLVAKVTVHRSPRYHVDEFPWKKIVEKYGPDIAFVGDPDEHRDFIAEFGPVRYFPTRTYMELAEVIAGSSLCVMNQSSPSWVAQGLRKTLIQEAVPRNHWAWNCHWERPGYWDIADHLPDV